MALSDAYGPTGSAHQHWASALIYLGLRPAPASKRPYAIRDSDATGLDLFYSVFSAGGTFVGRSAQTQPRRIFILLFHADSCRPGHASCSGRIYWVRYWLRMSLQLLFSSLTCGPSAATSRTTRLGSVSAGAAWDGLRFGGAAGFT
jgi:hypothetical protein